MNTATISHKDMSRISLFSFLNSDPNPKNTNPNPQSQRTHSPDSQKGFFHNPPLSDSENHAHSKILNNLNTDEDASDTSNISFPSLTKQDSSPEEVMKTPSFPSPSRTNRRLPTMSNSPYIQKLLANSRPANIPDPKLEKVVGSFTNINEKRKESFSQAELSETRSRNNTAISLNQLSVYNILNISRNHTQGEDHLDSSAHTSFHVRRSIVKNLTYCELPRAPESRNEDELDSHSSSSNTTSLIKANNRLNPYYYHMSHKNADKSIEQVEDQVVVRRERQRLKSRVFSGIFDSDQIELSKFVSLTNEIRRTRRPFTDADFPPNISSLIGGNLSEREDWEDCIWLRPDEFYSAEDFSVFGEDIEPSDIKQGELADCYFLASLSSLAQWPDRVKRIFVTKQKSDVGIYCVKVCEIGEWRDVIIDDYFPCKKSTRQPIFTSGKNELWVLILEKAWAKIYGSYSSIEEGSARECLHDLTGAPTEFYFTDEEEEWEIIWSKLVEASEKKYAMTCGTDGSFMEGSTGLERMHTYSLLGACEATSPGGRGRLVKLRNPWGSSRCEGMGKENYKHWKSHSSSWVDWSEEDDGVFVMTYGNFLKYFSDVQFCYIHDDYNYSYIQVSPQRRRGVYLRITVETTGEYYITVNQESKRRHAQNPTFRYSTVSIVVARVLGDGQYEYVTGANRADREVWAKGYLTCGDYLIYTKIQHTDKNPSNYGISSYGPSKASFEVVSKSDHVDFLEKTFISKARSSQTLSEYIQERDNYCLRAIDMSQDGFIYCYYRNISTKTLEVTGHFTKLLGVKLRKPHRGRLFNITVPPYQEKIVLVRILPHGEVEQIFKDHVVFRDSGEDLSISQGPFSLNEIPAGPEVPDFGSIITMAEIPGEDQEKSNLDEEAKSRGIMRRVKGNGPYEYVDICIYKLKHDEGIFLLIENETEDTILELKIGCVLEGLEPVGMRGNREIDVSLAPGYSHRVEFQKTGGEFSAKFDYKSSLVKLAH